MLRAPVCRFYSSSATLSCLNSFTMARRRSNTRRRRERFWLRYHLGLLQPQATSQNSPWKSRCDGYCSCAWSVLWAVLIKGISIQLGCKSGVERMVLHRQLSKSRGSNAALTSSRGVVPGSASSRLPVSFWGPNKNAAPSAAVPLLLSRRSDSCLGRADLDKPDEKRGGGPLPCRTASPYRTGCTCASTYAQSGGASS